MIAINNLSAYLSFYLIAVHLAGLDVIARAWEITWQPGEHATIDPWPDARRGNCFRIFSPLQGCREGFFQWLEGCKEAGHQHAQPGAPRCVLLSLVATLIIPDALMSRDNKTPKSEYAQCLRVQELSGPSKITVRRLCAHFLRACEGVSVTRWEVLALMGLRAIACRPHGRCFAIRLHGELISSNFPSCVHGRSGRALMRVLCHRYWTL